MTRAPSTSSRRHDVAAGLAVGGVAALMARDLDLRALVSFRHDDHAILLGSAVVAALLWPTRARVAVAAAALGLALLWLAVAFTPLSALLADGLVRRDAHRPADAIFVLASRIQPDGDLTTAAMGRLLHGLEHLARGDASRLILSELHAPSRSYAAPAATLMRNLGIEGELLTVGPVHNTRDEARQVADLCRSRGWKTVLLVTSPTHSRRAGAAFEREGLSIVSSPAMETRFDLETLGTPGDRLAAFGSIMHERVGLWVYRRRGWI